MESVMVFAFEKLIVYRKAVVRNRMPGGVGGRREQSRFLPVQGLHLHEKTFHCDL